MIEIAIVLGAALLATYNATIGNKILKPGATQADEEKEPEEQ